MLSLTNEEFHTLTDYMRSNFGINLDQKKILIEGRLASYLTGRGFKNFSQYFEALFRNRSQSEASRLVGCLTTNYSYFLREWEHFEFLKENVLPEIRSSIPDCDLRIWSAGCSTGEEPYTLAMLLNDFFGAESKLWDMKVLATDISQKALETGRAGVYTDMQMEKVPERWRGKYFKSLGGGRWEVNGFLRGEVIFRAFNLMEDDYPFQKPFHVIFCRNVMIYFDREARTRLIQKLYDAAQPGGYLFIGNSESLERGDTDWRYVRPSVFRKG